uniref:Uncharacterized protein n=1 Tax=Anguilla anguilla TaxID=7936 RepID=A0A0E9PTU2_ANGAN
MCLSVPRVCDKKREETYRDRSRSFYSSLKAYSNTSCLPFYNLIMKY